MKVEITFAFRYLDHPGKGIADTFTKSYSSLKELGKDVIKGMDKYPNDKIYLETFLTKDLE